jgi:hypothetical protein
MVYLLDRNMCIEPTNPLLLRQLQRVTGEGRVLEKVVRWHDFVRDSIAYDPYAISFDPDHLRASRTLENGRGHCIHKSIVFVSGCRALGVPAKLGLAKVRNHLGTGKLQERLGTDILTPHGYAQVQIEERWVKCSPVFNLELCEHLQVKPLLWDGRSDSLFQQQTANGHRFMEYLEDYGVFDSVPVPFIADVMRREYPQMFDANGRFMKEKLT